MFRGIDPTLGAPILEGVAHSNYESLHDDEKFKEFQYTEKFKRAYKNDCIVKLLCSYPRENFAFNDILWYKHIEQMIYKGSLYMRLFLVNNWAYPDKNYKDNISNLENVSGLNLKLSRTNGNSDALFETNEQITLYKVYYNDQQTIEARDSVEGIDAINVTDSYGIVEFGDQKICKSAATLLSNNFLLRVPYQIDGFPHPVCAIFFNTDLISKKIDDLLHNNPQ